MGRIEKAESILSLIDFEVKMTEVISKRNIFISTGSEPIDAVIKGFRFGELVVIGARPAMGKTKFLLKSALRISQNVPVLYCSIENIGRKVLNQIISLKKDGGKSFSFDHVRKSDFKIDLEKEELLVSDCIFDSMEEYLLLFAHHIINDGVKVIAIVAS